MNQNDTYNQIKAFFLSWLTSMMSVSSRTLFLFNHEMIREYFLFKVTSSGSFQTPFPSPGSNASSYNSLHRRWMRVQYTSLESGLKKRNSQDNLQAQDVRLFERISWNKQRLKFYKYEYLLLYFWNILQILFHSLCICIEKPYS